MHFSFLYAWFFFGIGLVDRDACIARVDWVAKILMGSRPPSFLFDTHMRHWFGSMDILIWCGDCVDEVVGLDCLYDDDQHVLMSFVFGFSVHLLFWFSLLDLDGTETFGNLLNARCETGTVLYLEL